MESKVNRENLKKVILVVSIIILVLAFALKAYSDNHSRKVFNNFQNTVDCMEKYDLCREVCVSQQRGFIDRAKYFECIKQCDYKSDYCKDPSNLLAKSKIVMSDEVAKLVVEDELNQELALNISVEPDNSTNTFISEINITEPESVVVIEGGEVISEVSEEVESQPVTKTIAEPQNSVLKSELPYWWITDEEAATIFMDYNEVFGGEENQNLVGTDGSDIIFGGKHDDTLTGGAGADVFYYRMNYYGAADSVCDGVDVITDFTIGEDKLYIDELSGMIQNNEKFASYEGEYIAMKADGKNGVRIDMAKTYMGNSYKNISGQCGLRIHIENSNYNYLDYFDPTWGSLLNGFRGFLDLMGDSFRIDNSVEKVFEGLALE